MSYYKCMNEKPLSAEIMKLALDKLDAILDRKIQLIVGGGGSMILAHHFPLATTDIDAIPKGIEIHELDVFVKKVAVELGLPGDWLNPYFATFSLTLPASFKERLVEVFHGKNLEALALGKEDMLIMKCFAHRAKDVGHAKSLIKQGADVAMVEDHISSLLERNFRDAQEALDFLDELLEDL